MKNKTNIVLVLRSGGRYSVEDVKLLSFHLHKWKGTMDIHITCLWDKINNPIRLFGVDFVPMHNPYRHWFSKMNIFDTTFQDFIGDSFLYIDLDTVIIGDYASIIPKKGEQNFITLEDFYRPGKLASGMMWIPRQGKMQHLWKVWKSKPDFWIKKYRGDQDFLRDNILTNVYWQKRTSLIGSMKPLPKMKPMVKQPKDKAIICFHGKPGIFQAAENIEWVSNYVKEYQDAR